MTALLPLLALANTSQAPTPAQVAKEKMQALAFIVGEWKGNGWQMRGQTKESFTGTETARWGAGGTALIIEGRQQDEKGSERYNGLVMITWNPARECYRFAQQTSAGTYAEYDAKLSDAGLVWKLRENLAVNLVVRNGEWLEEGFLINGDMETKIFELKMRKGDKTLSSLNEI